MEMWRKRQKNILPHIPILLLLLISPAFASPQEELEQTQKDIQATQAKQAALATQTAQLEAELKSLQDKLVSSAQTTQDAESNLTDAEDKLVILNEQLQAKRDALKAQQKNLEALVRAAIALSRTPPEAMAMMQGDPAETMQAARALQMSSDGIKEETHSIGLQMAELEKMKRKVAGHRESLGGKQTTLDKERKALERKLAERKALRTKLGSQQQEEGQKLATLAKKAEDLQGLLASIEKEEEAKRQSQAERSKKNKGKLRSFASARGEMRLPVAGKVVQSFGTPDQHDTTSKGIAIKARGGAQVTAPYDGEVVFSGPFLGYGQMVILRHTDDFHTLLAGLDTIDAEVGQFLLEGEPIGAMGDSPSGNRLYVELRKNNQPVNPATYIKIK